MAGHGFPARRGQQFHGLEGEDVVCSDLPAVHFEVKRTEKLELGPSMAQAIEDSGARMPVLVHRRNRREWLATLRAVDLLEILKSSRELQGS